MRFITMILCVFIAFAAAGCEKGYVEIRQGSTAEVYICEENATPEEIEQISNAIDDINSGITLSTGVKPLHLGGQIVDKGAYTEYNSGDHVHCIYFVYENYPTAYGRQLWRENHVRKDEGGFFDDNDDIVIFSNTSDGSCHLPNTPEGWPCSWEIQSIVEHELGHAFGRDHASEGSGENMVPHPESTTWTDGDFEDAHTVRDCL